MDNIILGIDIGSSKICSLIADIQSGQPRILGVGIAPSHGINKGAVKSIDNASRALKESLDEAKRMAGVDINKAYIALSGNCARSENVHEVTSLQTSEIGKKEINRIMQQADFKARHDIIPGNFELVHILPYSFKLDNREFIDDPFGMVGSQLEMSARVVYVHKADLANLKKVAQSAGVEVVGIVLNAYASSIATLTNDEKELGVCCMDMGSDSCNFMIHRGNSMQYEDFLPAGSWNITNDIATVLSTTIETAELIKKDFAKLNDLTPEDMEMTLERVPTRNGETRMVQYEVLHGIVFSRVFDMLQRIEQSIEKSGLKGTLGAGIVITGGMAYMNGLKDLAKKVFTNLSIRIAEPKDINESFEMLKKKGLSYACFSTAIGLILYASGQFTNYELDSNRKMKFKQKEHSRIGANLSDIDKKDDLEDIRRKKEDEAPTIVVRKEKGVIDKAIDFVKNLF